MNLPDTPTTRRIPGSREPRPTRNGPLPHHDSLADQDDVARKRSAMHDDKVSYLKVLVMSLLREIESLEGTVGDERNEDSNLQGEVRRFEAELIRNALVRTGGRQRRAARLLGTKVTTLNTKIKRYQIRIDDPAIHG
jgi:DNA-binding NtrC family response regulator